MAAIKRCARHLTPRRLRCLLIAAILLHACGCPALAAGLLKELNIHGFVEAAFGAKLRDDTTKHEDYNLFEQRLQLKSSYYPKTPALADMGLELNLKGDILVDEYFGAETDFDLREANILFSPLAWADIKAGRQVFTWGTGDYLFINDLFPKDYISFFIGRDDEYLKKPSDGVKLSVYNRKIANLDIIAIPLFEPNTMPKGDRLSFFDAFQGGIAARESDRHLIEPPHQFDNTELALRAYRNISGYETALYFFRGFYKAPQGYKNEMLRQLYYPRLDCYGASIRGQLLTGIANLEGGFYDSREDTDGDNRLIQNSSIKVMAGYEKDLGNDLRVGLQYMYEQTLDYDEYKRALLPADFIWDERRHLLTMRITQLLAKQTLRLSLFSFYSPSDDDIYLRPSCDYDITDQLKVSAGANLIWGQDDHTEFGQMQRNSNIYARLRYSF